MTLQSSRAIARRTADFFGLNRNVLAISASVFLMGLGEETWKRFVPKYLEALGAPLIVVGVYGTVRDLLDGLYQYPGGWLADRIGRRQALTLFVGCAMAGYALLAMSPTWHLVIAGLLF